MSFQQCQVALKKHLPWCNCEIPQNGPPQLTLYKSSELLARTRWHSKNIRRDPRQFLLSQSPLFVHSFFYQSYGLPFFPHSLVTLSTAFPRVFWGAERFSLGYVPIFLCPQWASFFTFSFFLLLMFMHEQSLLISWYTLFPLQKSNFVRNKTLMS